MIYVIFKWLDAEGRRVSTPREMLAVPRKGEHVSLRDNSSLEVHDVEWVIGDGASNVLVWLYPDSRL